jgi:N-[(2S)-2-amino-2-carboxyethyl]-L-glutamate dehydrogenase
MHSESEVAAALAEIAILSIVRDALIDHHVGLTILPAEACLYWPAPDEKRARSIAMHAYLAGPVARVGVKLINSAPDNPARGIPRAQGVIAMFDPVTAQVTDMLPAAEISTARTAAVSTLAAQRLAHPASRILTIVGAGPLGAAHAHMLLNADIGLEQAFLYDIDHGRAAALAASLRRTGVNANAAQDVKAAVRTADVLVAATTTREPYVTLDWLRPGALALNVGLDDLDADVLLRADGLYVDDWRVISEDTRRLLGRLHRRGLITGPGENVPRDGRAVSGEIGALLNGDLLGRTDSDQIIVVNPFGLGISDIALGYAVCEHIKASGLALYA